MSIFPLLLSSSKRALTCAAWLAAGSVGAQVPVESLATGTTAASPAAPVARPSAASSTVQSPVPSAASNARPHAVTLAAAQQGVLACSGRINQITQFLGVDDKSGAVLMLPPMQPDQRFVALAVEMPSPSTGNSAYVSATFAPNQANGCGATYEALAYWPQNCEDVARQAFAALKPLGRLKKDIAVLDGGAQLKVFLMPAGVAGCMSIKREMVL